MRAKSSSVITPAREAAAASSSEAHGKSTCCADSANVVHAVEPIVRSPPVLEVERGAVVDEPEPLVPLEQVGVPRGAVDVRDERVEEHDARSGRRVGREAGDRIEGDAAGQVVEPEVEPGARLERHADLGIGLARGELSVEIDEHELGHGEPGRARELTRHELGHEGLVPLPRAAQLHDVEAEVVRLDERRHRAALPERKHVADGSDGAHGAILGASRPRGHPKSAALLREHAKVPRRDVSDRTWQHAVRPPR
jgi:hypothetical protein